MKKVKKSAFLLLVLLGCIVISGCQSNSEDTVNSGEEGSTVEKNAEKAKSEDVTFESKRGTKIYSTVVTPAEMKDESYPVVLFSHGFVGNRQGDGAFPKIAEKLAENNILSIMIDFAGNNESEEPYTNYTTKN